MASSVGGGGGRCPSVPSKLSSLPDVDISQPVTPSSKRLMSYEDSFLPSLEICKWPIFSLLEPDFLSNIRYVCVFGNSGNEAMIVTKDDDVFAIGSNCSGCLGLGDVLSCLEPRRVEQLCRKNIVGMAYGSGPHVLAVTTNGDVFSWGHNGYCQLGNGSSNQGSIPTLVTINLTGRKVTAVACGSHHSMVMTSDGEIYAWGQNNCGQIGSGTTTNQPSPRKVTACIGHRCTVGISCGQTSSMAVLDNGDVFGWGYNGNGQLGLGNNVNQPNPCRVAGLQGVFVTQVVCGNAHTLALSDDGGLYSWGSNSYGQLGTGNKANMVNPTRIATERGRFVEVGAVHYNHLSAAVTQMGRVFMWGQCRGQSITLPLETPFHSIHDTLACFGMPSVTYKLIEVEHNDGGKVNDSLCRAFDDPGTGDVRFSVEGRMIHVHKAILKIRCEYFRNMFRSDWHESDKDVIDIPHYSYVVYRAFLGFLYTDEVNLLPEDAIGLLDLANAYCETRLKRLCERCIRQGITIDNAAMLYAAAIKFDARELQDFSFRFILNHMTAVTQTEAFMNLDEGVTKNLIKIAGQMGAFKF